MTKIVKSEKREEIINVSDTDSCQDLLKKYGNNDLLDGLYEILNDSAFLESKDGNAWKEKTMKVLFKDHNHFLELKKYMEKRKEENDYTKEKSLLFEGDELFQFYRKVFAKEKCTLEERERLFKKKKICKQDIIDFYMNINGSAISTVDEQVPLATTQNTRIYPQSINGVTNCLCSTLLENSDDTEEKTWTVCRDSLIVSNMNNPFEKFAFVNEEYHDRLLGKGMELIGISAINTNTPILWGLLRSDEVKTEISKYADPNIQCYCYRTLLENIVIDYVDTNNSELQSLSYDLANLISSNIYPNSLLHNNFYHKIKTILSYHQLDYYVLQQKLNVFSECDDDSKKNCLIVYSEKTKKWATSMQIHRHNKNDYNISESNEKDLFRAVANCNICLIALEINDVREWELVKSILTIINFSHIFIQPGDSKASISKTYVPFDIASRFSSMIDSPLNFCFYKNDRCLEINNKIQEIIDHDEYHWKVYKYFLLGFANCTPKSFKMVKCQGESVAKRYFDSKEFSVFEQLKIPLLNKAYTMQREDMDHYGSNSTINLLKEFDTKLRMNTSPENIWKKLIHKYKGFETMSLNNFICNYSNFIESIKNDIPRLYSYYNNNYRSSAVPEV